MEENKTEKKEEFKVEKIPYEERNWFGKYFPLTAWFMDILSNTQFTMKKTRKNVDYEAFLDTEKNHGSAAGVVFSFYLFVLFIVLFPALLFEIFITNQYRLITKNFKNWGRAFSKKGFFQKIIYWTISVIWGIFFAMFFSMFTMTFVDKILGRFYINMGKNMFATILIIMILSIFSYLLYLLVFKKEEKTKSEK